MFHHDKSAVAIILGKMKPKRDDAGDMEEHAEMHPDESLHACAEDLLGAIQARDAAGVADALKAFFHVCDAMPHEEGEHVSEEQEHGYEE